MLFNTSAVCLYKYIGCICSVSRASKLFVSPTCFLKARQFKITSAFAMFFNTSAVCLYKYVGCICSVSRTAKFFVSPTCFLIAWVFKITGAFAIFFNTSAVRPYKYVGRICGASRITKLFVSQTCFSTRPGFAHTDMSAVSVVGCVECELDTKAYYNSQPIISSHNQQSGG